MDLPKCYQEERKNLNKVGKEMQKLKKTKMTHVLIVLVLCFSCDSKNSENVKSEVLNKSRNNPNNFYKNRIEKIKNSNIKLKTKKLNISYKDAPKRETKFYKNGILVSDTLNLQIKEIELNAAGDFYDSTGGILKIK